jgi:murein tripeptide amidase MpaA
MQIGGPNQRLAVNSDGTDVTWADPYAIPPDYSKVLQFPSARKSGAWYGNMTATNSGTGMLAQTNI